MSDMKDENIIILYQCSVTVDSIVKSDVLAYRQCLFSYYGDSRHTYTWLVYTYLINGGGCYQNTVAPDHDKIVGGSPNRGGK